MSLRHGCRARRGARCRLRGCSSTAPSSSSRRTSDMAPRVVFDGVWKKFQARRASRQPAGSHPGAWSAGLRRRAPERRARRVLGAARRLVRGRSPGEALGHHRPQRRRQVHDPQAADAHPASPLAGRSRRAGPRRRAHRGRRRLPSRSDRAGERVPAGRHHGHAAGRDRRASFDEIVEFAGVARVHRHAGQALLSRA